MDTMQGMKTFVTVVDTGSFTRAADALAISPQLVSKYMAQLEQHLGVRLLNRTTRRLHLTEAGRQYYQRAQQILEDIEDLECQLTDMQNQARGVLRISAPVSFAIRHLPPLLQQYQQQHPQVTIDLQLNDRKVDILDEGFGIALRIGQLASSSLIARRLAPVRVVYCASPGYLARHGTPTSPTQLKGHTFLKYSYMDAKFSNGAQSTLSCNNGDVLTAAAIGGAGIVLQPTFIVSDAIRRGDLTIVMPEHEPEPIALYAVYAHRQLLASKVTSFLQFISNYYGDSPYWDAL